MFTKEKIKPENSLLQTHKESTLEKAQAKRDAKKNPLEIEVNGKDDIINKRINQRLKRKQMIHDAMNKIKDPDDTQ